MNSFISKNPFRSGSKVDTTRGFTRPQGYYRDQETDDRLLESLTDEDLSVYLQEKDLEHENDLQLEKKIMIVLDHCVALDTRGIAVMVSAGEVNLKGSVPTLEMKLVAEQAIQDIPGLKKIHNFIGIDIPPHERRIGAFSSSEKIM